MRNLLFTVAALCVCACTPSPPPPTQSKSVDVKPSTEAINAKAFKAGPLTQKLPDPKPGDWVDEHAEPGQSIKTFRLTKKPTPTDGRNTIYIQPIGEFETWAPTGEEMKRFTSTFFQLPVKVLPQMKVHKKIRKRKHGPWGTQLLTTDILALLKKSVPKDAFCVLAVTMHDLYPDPSWNFVFGQATFRQRVGVFSFARHNPAKPNTKPNGKERKLMMLRSYKTLSHEIGHMFGIRHCTDYLCGMNGTNSQDESDRHPLNYCPVCLNKLHESVGFDVAARDGQLSTQLKADGLSDAAEYYEKHKTWLVESNP